MEIVVNKKTFSRIKDKIVTITAKFKPIHWFLLGVIITLVIRLFFPVLDLFLNVCNWILFQLMYQLGMIFGMEESRSWELINIIYSDELLLSNPYEFTDFATYFTDFIAAAITWMGLIGRKAWEIVIEYFPVLLDFNLDLDFINLDFVKILRSVFSVLQFVIIFIIARKFRIWLRKVIKKRINDNDYFDKQFYQIVRI